MSESPVSIDLGSVLPYAEEKILALFGKDEATQSRKAWLKQLHDTAVEITRSVQCIGMHRPVPFDRIYQPTKLLVRSADIWKSVVFANQNRMARSIALSRSLRGEPASVSSFIDSADNAIVFAGPGWGKTTFLHAIFRQKVNNKSTYTALITLRRTDAVADLEELVALCTNRIPQKKAVDVLLLVDGYDEIDVPSRKRVSDALIKFSAANVGRFILSCREHYPVIDLKANHVYVDCFDKQDKYRFVGAFLAAFESKLDPIDIVDDFENRNLGDFLSHPLLLALACIVQSGKNSQQPRSALRLLERALITLQYTWDMDKGIDRQRLTGLDGGDRIEILKRIAFATKSPFLQGTRAQMITKGALERMQILRTDPDLVLRETAQFYGILVPTFDGWEFVHRSIHDYLAARFWVESGAFATEKNYEWETRTAYAACISGDATRVITEALLSTQGHTCLAETLMNAPTFQQGAVAEALITYYSVPGRISGDASDGWIEWDVFRFMSRSFLLLCLQKLCKSQISGRDVLVGYCLAALRSKRLRLDSETFGRLSKIYPHQRFPFRAGGTFVTLEMAKPVAE